MSLDEVISLIYAILGVLFWLGICYFLILCACYMAHCQEEKDKFYNNLDVDKQYLIDEYERQYRKVKFTLYPTKITHYRKHKDK